MNPRFSLDASDAYPPLLKRTLLHITVLVASIQNLPCCKEWCCQIDWSFSNSFCSTFVMKMLKITWKRKGTDLESWDNKIQSVTKNHTTDTCIWKSYRESAFMALQMNRGKESNVSCIFCGKKNFWRTVNCFFNCFNLGLIVVTCKSIGPRQHSFRVLSPQLTMKWIQGTINTIKDWEQHVHLGNKGSEQLS